MDANEENQRFKITKSKETKTDDDSTTNNNVISLNLILTHSKFK
jgi:hypothetical protein